MFTLRYRTLMAFATGLAIALIGVFAFQAWRADAAPGDSDTTFVPITPCRLIDTRPNVPGQPTTNVGPRSTPIPENNPVTFTAWGTGDANSVCDIPSSATAISTNTTIVNPTNNSFLTLYPADKDWPGTSNLNYVAGQSATPNAVTSPLSPTGQFNVFNRFGTVDVIVDIVSYYTESSLTTLANDIRALKSDTYTIPSGVTVVGNIWWDDQGAGATGDIRYTIDLPARAPTNLEDVNFAADSNPLTVDDDPTCTGSTVAPTAPSGKVCIYLIEAVGADNVLASSLGSLSLRDRSFYVQWFPSGTGDMYVYATWAYTAP